jgi:hypothetical protein
MRIKSDNKDTSANKYLWRKRVGVQVCANRPPLGGVQIGLGLREKTKFFVRMRVFGGLRDRRTQWEWAFTKGGLGCRVRAGYLGTFTGTNTPYLVWALFKVSCKCQGNAQKSRTTLLHTLCSVAS